MSRMKEWVQSELEGGKTVKEDMKRCVACCKHCGMHDRAAVRMTHSGCS
jgi:hypothetical protein